MSAARSHVNHVEQDSIFTPLYWATMNDDNHAIQSMVAEGADVYFACGETVQIAGVGAFEPTPMSLVVLKDDVVKLDIMMERATQSKNLLDFFSCMLLAKLLSSSNVHEVMRSHTICDEAMVYAIKFRFLSFLKTLLEAGVLIENQIDQGNTALLFATDNRTGIADENFGVVDILIKAHACVNAKRVIQEDSFTTPLYHAMIANDLNVVYLLLSSGACVENIVSSQGITQSAIECACLMGHLRLVQMLTRHELYHGRDLRSRPEFMYCAVLNDSPDVVAYLVDHDAPYRSALKLCYETENSAILEVIRERVLDKINRRLAPMALKKHMARRRLCRNVLRARILGGATQFLSGYNDSLASVVVHHLTFLESSK